MTPMLREIRANSDFTDVDPTELPSLSETLIHV